MNTIDAVHKSVASEEVPPADLNPALQAIWWDRKGDWHRAHEATQQASDATVAWVHAYLHRKEGDLSNAAYWYARASKPVADGSLDQEREAILTQLLAVA
jgi:hypothetical protein